MKTSNKKINNIFETSKKKIIYVSVMIFVTFVMLTLNLWSIMTSNNENYNQLVLSQKQISYDTSTIEAKRGDILDAKGRILATSIKVYNLILDPKVINSSNDNYYINPTIDALNYIYGYDKLDLYNIIVNKKDSQYVRYKRRLSLDDKNKFEEYQNTKNREYRSLNLPYKIVGVWYEDEYMRVYPFNSFAANVIGFTNEDGTNGVMGLERYYNDILNGTNGRKYAYLNDKYDLEGVIKNAIDGNNIIVSLDYDIQTIVENQIANWQKNDIGSKEISVIVMNPMNSEVIAMASNNSFDLNNPRDLYMYTVDELYDFGAEYYLKEYNNNHNEKVDIETIKKIYNYDDILNVGKEQAYYKNWKNNCIQNTFEPGSTSKIFTVAGALDENLVNEETKFLCEGKIELFDGDHTWTIKCNNRNGHGELSLLDAVTVSCNMSMSSMAESLGVEKFAKYQEIFGFGQKTNIDLSYEADTSSLVYTKEKMGRTALATNAFGQNFNCTMIQMISAYASILNGGYYYKPHLLKRVENKKGAIISEFENIPIRKTSSDRTINFIKNALFETVENGTGKAAHIENVTVGGKTGTAEKLPRINKNYIVSFCGFAPVENPKYLIYVVIDEPNLEGEQQAKAVFATNVFRKILKDILNQNYLDSSKDLNNDIINREGIVVATAGNAINISLKQNENVSYYDGKVSDEIIENEDLDPNMLPAIMP